MMIVSWVANESIWNMYEFEDSKKKYSVQNNKLTPNYVRYVVKNENNISKMNFKVDKKKLKKHTCLQQIKSKSRT